MRGFWATGWRDVPGWAVFFGVYEGLKENRPDFGSGKRAEVLNYAWVMNAGGTAGALSWAVGLPQDIIKTLQQNHRGAKPISFEQAARQLVKEGGLGRLFKGGSPTLIKGYYTGLISLPLFDLVLRELKKRD